MTDQNSQFFAILTAIGEAKQANADAMGIPWAFTAMGVGDANGTEPLPDRLQTRLVNERRRAPINQVRVDANDPSIIITEQVIPPDVGGWWIREIGLYDADGDLVAVANCAPSYKPLLAQGTGKTQVVRINLVVRSTGNITLKIDPAVVLATREYVDTKLNEVVPASRSPGSYTKVTINARGIVVAGENPTTLAGNGITDAYTKAQTDNLLTAKAAKATTLGGYGITDAYTQAQANALINAKADKSTTLAGYGISDAYTKTQADALLQAKLPVHNAAMTGAPTCSTAALGTANLQVANTLFVQNMVNALIGAAPGALDTLAEIAAALGNDANFAATITNQLAGKAAKATTLAGYGVPFASRPEAIAGTVEDKPVSPSGVAAALDALDPWSLMPIGVPFPVMVGAAEPPTSKSYRYIKLSANDAYNTGVLTGESVSGLAPLVIAYGRISLSGSPITGNTVYLINTERRFIRPGAGGSLENDQLQGHSFQSGTAAGGDGVVFDTWTSGALNSSVKASIVTDGTNGTPRIGIETRPKNIGANYYMRIK